MIITAFAEGLLIFSVMPLISSLIGISQNNFVLETTQKISFLNFIEEGKYIFFILDFILKYQF